MRINDTAPQSIPVGRSIDAGSRRSAWARVNRTRHVEPVHENGTPDFWDAWNIHRAGLLKKSLKRTGGNLTDAEDMLSTAMLRALEAFLRQAPRPSNMEAWLTRIIHSTCMDMHRRRRHQALTLSEDEEGQTGMQEFPPFEQQSPEQLFIASEQLRALRQRLVALPESLRQPCTMRFESEMPYEDIARALGLTVVNVRRRIWLSYQQLREELK